MTACSVAGVTFAALGNPEHSIPGRLSPGQRAKGVTAFCFLAGTTFAESDN
jgi:hypothetical protein